MKFSVKLLLVGLLGISFAMGMLFNEWRHEASSKSDVSEMKTVDNPIEEKAREASKEEQDGLESIQYLDQKVVIRGEARPSEGQVSAEDGVKIAFETLKANGVKEMTGCEVSMIYIDFFEYWTVHFDFSSEEKYEVIIKADDFDGQEVFFMEKSL